MADRDLVLLETVKTHRARLVSAFLSGELAERRVVNDNLRRLLGGLVLAAVFCAACVGFSFVSAQLGRQAMQQRQQQGLGPATGPVVASDTFDRTVPTGWGGADRGGRWQLIGPADAYAVSGGAGRIQLTGDPSTTSRGGYLPGLEEDRADLTVTVHPTAGLTGSGLSLAVQGRRVSSGRDYRAVVRLSPGGGTTVALVRVFDGDPTGQRMQQLSSSVSSPGSAGSGDQVLPVSVRIQVVGSNPTTVRAKVWAGSGAEPQDWTVTAQDSTPGLQRPGTVGLLAQRVDAAETADLAVSDLIDRRVS